MRRIHLNKRLGELAVDGVPGEVTAEIADSMWSFVPSTLAPRALTIVPRFQTNSQRKLTEMAQSPHDAKFVFNEPAVQL